MTSDWYAARHCGDKLITRAEIERATAEYLADGGQITKIVPRDPADHYSERILPDDYDAMQYRAHVTPNSPMFIVISDVIYYQD
jgi:hypothetical protein